ncbi:hypothetical protein KUHS_16520 [Streptococcus salivarius]|uniref:hypothetical protein n=1 Tax=Streptococcus salivarius TaxID=1304 RepID=UPI00066D24F3|nr:hypothetical protein [Streptococcus salivarius]
MSRDSLHKVILYNYLYEFSSLENKIKDKFKQILLEKDDEDIKNNFLLLHLSEEIKLSFTEDISNNAFKINKKSYKRNIGSVKIKWNLKKQLEFANKNNFLSDILPIELKHFVKKETISTHSFLVSSIQLRNKLAHETCDIKIRRDLELLSDDKLNDLITGDDAFDELCDLAEIDTIYKQALTHYFYLKKIDEKLS